jgi:hypothetical protein
MKRIACVICGCLLAVGVCASAADDVGRFEPPSKVPATGIGFRGDGTGVYPDANPPVEWDERTGSNILWKAELPNWGYASPVPVGNRVLMITEPGYESIWPQLTCYDAASGKVVWQKDVVAPQAGEKDIADMKAHAEMLQACYRIMYPIDGSGFVGEDDPRWKPINRQLAEYDLKCNRFKKGYGLLRYVRETSSKWKDIRRRLAKERGICVETTWARFGRARIGHAFPTPVSDGNSVFVQTRHGTVASFDIASGRKNWDRHILLKGRGNAEIMSSPRIWGDLLLVGFIYCGGEEGLYALDRRTGKIRWNVSASAKGPIEGYRSRTGGSLVIMDIGGTPVVLCSSGAVVRLPDGKPLEGGVPKSCGTYAVDDENDRIFGAGSSDGKNSAWGLKLSLKGEKLTADLLYRTRRAYGGMSGIYVDGLVFAPEWRIDPSDGWPVDFEKRADKKRLENLAQARARDDRRLIDWQLSEFLKRHKDAPDNRHTMLSAAGRVYGMTELDARHAKRYKAPEGRDLGVCEVYSTKGKHLATNILLGAEWDAKRKAKWHMQGFPAGFSYACQMNIAGDRLYACSQDYLYCIGTRPADRKADGSR